MLSMAACSPATSTEGACPGAVGCAGKGNPEVDRVRGSQPAASAIPRGSEKGGLVLGSLAPVASSAAVEKARRQKAGGA